MGFGIFGSILVLTLFFVPSLCQQPNTDGFFVSDFFRKMGLSLNSSSPIHNFSAPVCSWQGVFCDIKQENVVAILASGFGLSGLIPDNTIGKLMKLQTLDLSNNRITGLPSDLWSLGSLKTLNLSLNQIADNLSSNIGNFGQLQMLDLSSNNFSGNIPEAITSLLSLEYLVLNRNGFEGTIPMGILNLRSLVFMDMSSNKLNGNLPDDFSSSFPKLKALNLARNQIHGRDLDLIGMESISYLNVSGNLFQGSVINLFLGPLEVLDLSKNQFQGHITEVNFSSTFDWSRLVHLDISENQLSGEISDEINRAHKLKHLNFASNRFSKQKLDRIYMLSGLEYLNLSGTNLIGHIPSGISLLNSLTTLDLSRNHLSSHIPLLSLKNLQVLDVSYNNLSGEIPISILEKLPWMERFNFSYNNLTLCSSEFSTETLKSAFIGSLNSCPIAANPAFFKRKSPNRMGLKLALALTLSMVCLLVGLLFLAFGCRRKTKTWTAKQDTIKEEQNISGPFSFQTDSTTWVADIKQANSVPVVIFEKPLLNFTFSDLLNATSQFDRDTLLAEGRFGPVYRGFLPGGIHVAVKVLVHGSTMTDDEAAKELEYLGRIKHPNLVPLMGYCLAGEQRIAIYDYMENGNLQNLLHDLPLGIQAIEDLSNETWEEEDEEGESDRNGGIRNFRSESLVSSWKFRHKIALGTARALAFLHHGCSPPIIHRDVKSSSIYLDSNLDPRLSDFGLSKIFGNDLDGEYSGGMMNGYVPPEFVLPPESGESPRSPTPKLDIFGFGVVLFELITGKKPVGDDYSGEREGRLVSWVRGLVRKNEGLRAIDPKIIKTGTDDLMVEALKIGYLCTAEHPSKRPSMQQVVGLLKDIEPQ